ncbi:unnamed protein product, partial [marine sediment metagenome]
MKLPSNFELFSPPRDYQKRTILYGITNPEVGLILPVGSGKTYCSINIARYRIQNNDVKKIIILAPKTILFNWLDQIRKFSEYDGIVLYDSIRQNRIGLIEKFKESDIHFGIVNYDAIRHYYNEFLSLNNDMIIADESSRYIQTHSSKRTQIILDIFKYIEYKYILTATLIPNHPLNLWSQFMFLNNGKTFGKNFWSFRSRLFREIKKGKFKKWALKHGMEKHVGNAINESCIIVPVDEVVKELPGEVNQTIEVL